MSFEIVKVAPTVAANAWTEAAQALLDAHATDAEAGIAITVPAGETKDGADAEGQKDRIAFQKAARALGYTARLVSAVGDDKGNYVLTFKHTELNAPRRGGKAGGEAESESASVEDVAPAE